MWSGSASASPSGDMNGATTTAGGKTRSHRRPRVALACQRCKARKQKCDGKKPTCSNCSSFQIICEYVEPPKPLSQSRGEYYKAAEERVAELEEILSKAGIEDAGQTQWREIQSAQKAGNDHSSSYHPFKRPRDEPPGVEDGRDGSSTRRRLSFDVAEILRDLSLNASGGYIGASSSFTLSRLVASLVRKIDRSDADGTNYAQENQLSTKSFVEKTVGAEQYLQLRSVPEDVADKLLRGYGIHLSTHWPILHSTHIRSLHSRRSSLRSSYEKSILHLVYAIGGRFLECTGEMGAFQCQQHHRAAMQYLDEVIQYHDLRSIQMLILLGIYSLRDPKGPGAWTYIGLAMRTCVDLGMHRRDRGGTESLLEAEMRKRVFWTAYSLDRQNSIMLGRPFAISDRDIDAELPVDVNESIQDETSLRKALEASRSRCEGDAPKTSTSLSPFVHIIRLRQIESQIQQTIYRVDRPTVPSVAQVEKFIGILEDWKERIPRDARHHSANSPTETTDTNFIPGYAYYLVYYYKSLRFLLHPLLSAPDTPIELIQKCTEACGGVCQTYKKLHENVPVGFSTMALYSVFLAGLTMVYCTWALPQQIFNMSTSNDMNACSIVLYVITERWPGAKKYRDMYEDIKRNVLESIEENQYQPRHALKRLNSSIFKSMQRTEEGRADVDQLMTDMVGEALPLTRDGGNPDSQLDHLSRNTSMWPGMTDVPDGSSLLSSMPAVSSQQQQRPGPNIDNSLAMVPDLDLFNAFDQQVLEAGEFDFGLSAPGYQF